MISGSESLHRFTELFELESKALGARESEISMADAGSSAFRVSIMRPDRANEDALLKIQDGEIILERVAPLRNLFGRVASVEVTKSGGQVLLEFDALVNLSFKNSGDVERFVSRREEEIAREARNVDAALKTHRAGDLKQYLEGEAALLALDVAKMQSILGSFPAYRGLLAQQAICVMRAFPAKRVGMIDFLKRCGEDDVARRVEELSTCRSVARANDGDQSDASVAAALWANQKVPKRVLSRRDRPWSVEVHRAVTAFGSDENFNLLARERNSTRQIQFACVEAAIEFMRDERLESVLGAGGDGLAEFAGLESIRQGRAAALCVALKSARPAAIQRFVGLFLAQVQPSPVPECLSAPVWPAAARAAAVQMTASQLGFRQLFMCAMAARQAKSVSSMIRALGALEVAVGGGDAEAIVKHLEILAAETWVVKPVLRALRSYHMQFGEQARMRKMLAGLFAEVGESLADLASKFAEAGSSPVLRKLCDCVVKRAWELIPAGGAVSRRMSVVAWELTRFCVLMEAEQMLLEKGVSFPPLSPLLLTALSPQAPDPARPAGDPLGPRIHAPCALDVLSAAGGIQFRASRVLDAIRATPTRACDLARGLCAEGRKFICACDGIDCGTVLKAVEDLHETVSRETKPIAEVYGAACSAAAKAGVVEVGPQGEPGRRAVAYFTMCERKSKSGRELGMGPADEGILSKLLHGSAFESIKADSICGEAGLIEMLIGNAESGSVQFTEGHGDDEGIGIRRSPTGKEETLGLKGQVRVSSAVDDKLAWTEAAANIVNSCASSTGVEKIYTDFGDRWLSDHFAIVSDSLGVEPTHTLAASYNGSVFEIESAGVLRRFAFAVALAENPAILQIQAERLDIAHALFAANLHPAINSMLILGASRRVSTLPLSAFGCTPALCLAFVRPNDAFIYTEHLSCAPGVVEPPNLVREGRGKLTFAPPSAGAEMHEINDDFLTRFDEWFVGNSGTFRRDRIDPLTLLKEFGDLADLCDGSPEKLEESLKDPEGFYRAVAAIAGVEGADQFCVERGRSGLIRRVSPDAAVAKLDDLLRDHFMVVPGAMRAFERLAETNAVAVLDAAALLVAARTSLQQDGEPFFAVECRQSVY